MKKLLLLGIMLLGMGGVSAQNHYLEITTNAVKNNPWEWAIHYDLATPLETGKKYILSMDAKCSEEFGMAFWPYNTAEGGKTTYTGYNIGTEWSTCTCEFEAGDALNRLAWNFGSLNGKLCFDNVKLVEKGTSTNLLTGGDFESGLDANWGDDGWNKPEYSIYGPGSTPSRYLKMSTNSVKDNPWEWAIWYQLDTPLEKDKTYVLSMKAKCSEEYNMSFWPYKTGDGGGVNYTGYNIGTEWGDCSCTFTAADDLTHLKWCFGSLNGTVWFDDVRLVEQGTTTNLINDGGFDEGIASNWGNDGWNSPQYGVIIEFPEVKAVVPVSEVQLTQEMFKTWSSPDAAATITSNNPYFAALSYGETGTSGSCFYGSGNVSYLDYADLSNYSAMKIYGTGSALRILMNRVEDNGALTEVLVTPSAEGTLLDLSSYSYVHLNAIKVVSGGGETTITNITLIDPSASTGTDYVINGDLKDGHYTASATSALEDEDAKVIDVTAANGSNISLVSANPNCLIVANNGMLTNDNNVIVNKACAKLVLVDGKPFYAPFNFTSASSSYSRTTSVGEWATAVLPFDLDVTGNDDATYYTFTSATATSASFEEVTTGTIAANTPFLYQATGTSVEFVGGNISATIDGYNIQAIGETGWYIAQSMESKVIDDVTTDPFFKDYDVYGIAGDDLVHATKKLTTKPFRAFYLKPKSVSAGSRLLITIDDSEATAINEVDADADKVTTGAIYNMAGQQVDANYKGVVIDENGRKYLQK